MALRHFAVRAQRVRLVWKTCPNLGASEGCQRVARGSSCIPVRAAVARPGDWAASAGAGTKCVHVEVTSRDEFRT